MQIDLELSFREAVRAFNKPRRREIARVIDAVRDGFGKPHLHSGLGIRRLRQKYFECRVGLQTRLIFRAERGVLHFLFIGSHDDIRNLLKNL